MVFLEGVNCQYVQKISEKRIFNTSEDAIKNGYKPCMSCKPCNTYSWSYIGNKSSKILHAAGCSWGQKIGKCNKEEDLSKEKAMEKIKKYGYKACKVCQRCNKSENKSKKCKCLYFKNQNSCSFCPLLGR